MKDKDQDFEILGENLEIPQLVDVISKLVTIAFWASNSRQLYGLQREKSPQSGDVGHTQIGLG